MSGHLYFICPTDHLESIIDDAFKHENCYITSLGNSIEFDEEMVSVVNELLDSKDITNIFFVLTQNNRVVLEAMENEHSAIPGLNGFQNKIKRQMNHAQEVWNTKDPNFLALSYHLNDKVKELRQALIYLRANPPAINGIIYNQFEKTFKSVCSNLMYENHVSVN